MLTGSIRDIDVSEYIDEQSSDSYSAYLQCAEGEWDVVLFKSDQTIIYYTWGWLLTYTVTVSNSGSGTSTDLSISDDTSSVFDQLVWATCVWSGAWGTNLTTGTNWLVFTAHVDQLYPNSALICTLTGTIRACTSGEVLANTGIVTVGWGDTWWSWNNIDTATGICQLQAWPMRVDVQKLDQQAMYMWLEVV